VRESESKGVPATKKEGATILSRQKTGKTFENVQHARKDFLLLGSGAGKGGPKKAGVRGRGCGQKLKTCPGKGTGKLLCTSKKKKHTAP